VPDPWIVAHRIGDRLDVGADVLALDSPKAS